MCLYNFTNTKAQNRCHGKGVFYFWFYEIKKLQNTAIMFINICQNSLKYLNCLKEGHDDDIWCIVFAEEKLVTLNGGNKL